MSARRFVITVAVSLAVTMTAAAQTVGKSKVYRVSVEKIELYLDAAASTAAGGSITARPGLAKAELRLGLEALDVASEDFRMTHYQNAATVPGACPAGWFHMHLAPCPKEPFAACTTICWAHPSCGATMSWTPGTVLCSDECDCFPDGSD